MTTNTNNIHERFYKLDEKIQADPCKREDLSNKPTEPRSAMANLIPIPAGLIAELRGHKVDENELRKLKRSSGILYALGLHDVGKGNRYKLRCRVNGMHLTHACGHLRHGRDRKRMTPYIERDTCDAIAEFLVANRAPQGNLYV